MHPSGGGGSLPVPLFPRPLRARIRMRDAAPSLCRTERMDAWPRCLERLEAEFPAEDVHAWLKPLQATWRDDATVLYAPNTFIRAEVRSRYLGRIRELLGHFAGTPEVTLEIGSLPRAVADRTAPPLPARTTADAVDFAGTPHRNHPIHTPVHGRNHPHSAPPTRTRTRRV